MIALRIVLPFAIVSVGIAALLTERPVNALLWSVVALLAVLQASMLLSWRKPERAQAENDDEPPPPR